MLISVLLGSLIFYYSYHTIHTTSKNHEGYKSAVERMNSSSEAFRLLYEDLQSSSSGVSVVSFKEYDRITLLSKNSMYGFQNAFVTYFVSKKDNALVRVESKEAFDIFSIGNNKRQDLPFMFGEVLFTECESFRVYVDKDKKRVNLFLKKKNADAVLFSVLRGKI